MMPRSIHKYLCFIAITFALLPSIGFSQSESKTDPIRLPREPVTIPFGFAVFSPLDTDPSNVKVIHNIEFNLFYGSSYGLKGFALSSFVNKWDADTDGVEIAGFVNIAEGETRGIQIASLHNYSGGDVTGAQISGLFNHSYGSLTGVQLSWLNRTKEISSGAQIGLANSAGSANAVQIGLVNDASNLAGAQVGLVNVAAEVTGVQFGLVNISTRNQYGQVGILNIDTSNFFQFYAGSGSSTKGMVGLKSGSGWLYGNFALASRYPDAERFENTITLITGLGTRMKISVFTLTAGLNFDASETNHKPFSLALGGTSPLPFLNSIEVFAQGGPAFNHKMKFLKQDFLAGLQYRIKEELNTH